MKTSNSLLRNYRSYDASLERLHSVSCFMGRTLNSGVYTWRQQRL